MPAPAPLARTLGAIAGGAALLLWPALLNGYPLVFSDTGAFLAQTVEAWPIWDKPFVYGPLLHLFHWRWSLWPPAIAQALLVSWLLWLAQRAWRGQAGAGVHLALVGGLVAGTAAPWVVSLLLPDVFAPVLVLALALLGFGGTCLGRAERAALGVVATVAVASHLSHLPLALALCGLVVLMRRRWRPVAWVASPVLAAVVVLVASNAALFGRPALSPFGSVFLLARLVADGPAARTLEAVCRSEAQAAPDWRLCGWVGRLPADSDLFLWRGDGPVWSDPGGPIALADEAGAIVRATLAREPLGVVRAGVANALAQAARFDIGDTLVPDHLAGSVGRQLALGFPAAEQARFAAGLQARGALPARAAPWLGAHAWVLALGALGLAVALRRPPRGLLLAVPLALVVNAAVTGALSKPHHRYQARLIWLLPLVGLAALPVAARRPC